MARLVLTSLASWGDLFPFIALGLGLQRAGHDVAVAASPAYSPMIEAEGLQAVPLGRAVDLEAYAEHPEILSSRNGGLDGLRAVLGTFLFSQIDRLVADTRRGISGADLVLTHPAFVPAFLASELDHVPIATVSASLGFLPSQFVGPTGHSVLPGGLGRAQNRLAWALATRALGSAFDAEVNRARRQVGLAEHPDAFVSPMRPPTPAILLVSPVMVGHPVDWSEDVTIAGFPKTHRLRSWTMPPSLETFLQASEPPILVTLGSSSSLDAGDFYTTATRAIRAIGRRALILTGPVVHGELPESEDDALRLDYAPFDVVAQRCSAAINHAGIGSLASFLAAGIPQHLVPRAFDQQANARRAVRLGVARAVGWRSISVPKLTRELRRLLARTNYADRAAAIAEQVSVEDGIATAVRAVARLLEAPPKRAR